MIEDIEMTIKAMGDRIIKMFRLATLVPLLITKIQYPPGTPFNQVRAVGTEIRMHNICNSRPVLHSEQTV